ncbi:hypothetical protein DWQ67_04350 [Galactobacter caseinivorans]|uniref:Uncharacterized protein n=1 Tax=Galactobacter caseinivorans TaxID=2676123 RepID=A0A496PLC8_9MICC|nr:hypothetical protein DWQ67_04350 [Galactobacter caseinivorans]
MEWISFVQVAGATMISALLVVGLYGLGVRLQAVAEDQNRNRTLQRAGSWLCFGLCGVLVLFGIILIIPALHSIVGL